MSAEVEIRYWACIAALASVGTIVGGFLMPTPLRAQGNQRAFSDFLSTQGTTMIFTPPAPDQLGWTTGVGKTNGNANLTPTRFALVDYAGLEAKFLSTKFGINLGTTVTGTVMERSLADGTALVTVDVHTKNALGWAIDWDPNGPASQFNSSPLLFGARVLDVVAGRAPALGDSHLIWQFVNRAPGAPIPDLVTATQCGCIEISSLSFQASITGLLHAPEFTESTSGRLHVQEIGPIQTSSKNGGHGPLSDGYPVEAIDLTPLGE
jgi:hypothetical protein